MEYESRITRQLEIPCNFTKPLKYATINLEEKERLPLLCGWLCRSALFYLLSTIISGVYKMSAINLEYLNRW